MDKLKQITELALDIDRVASLGLEISGAIAKDLHDEGYRKVEQGWISVEDRLPNKYESVLVLSNAGYISIDSLCGDNIWLEHRIIKVTHWMPLPTPPKMKGAE